MTYVMFIPLKSQTPLKITSTPLKTIQGHIHCIDRHDIKI